MDGNNKLTSDDLMDDEKWSEVGADIAKGMKDEMRNLLDEKHEGSWCYRCPDCETEIYANISPEEGGQEGWLNIATCPYCFAGIALNRTNYVIRPKE